MNSDLYESALLRLSLILTPLLTGRPEEQSVKECLNDLRQALHEPVDWGTALNGPCPHCKGEGCVEGGSAEVHGAQRTEYLPCPAGCTPPWEER